MIPPQSNSIEHLMEQIKIAKELSDMHEQKCYMLCFTGVFIALDILSQVYVYQSKQGILLEAFNNTGADIPGLISELAGCDLDGYKEICKSNSGVIFQNGLKGLGFSSENDEIIKTYKLRNSLLHRFSTTDGYNINPNSSKTGRIIEDDAVCLPEVISFIERKHDEFIALIGESGLNNIIDRLYFI